MPISEDRVHTAVCKVIKLKYKKVIFTSDLSGVIMDWKSAKKTAKMRSESKIPDLLIFEPRGGWAGLFIELKATKEKLYKKDGSLKETAHINDQKDMLERLLDKGYKATFAGGMDEILKVVADYMDLEPNYKKREGTTPPLKTHP